MDEDHALCYLTPEETEQHYAEFTDVTVQLIIKKDKITGASSSKSGGYCTRSRDYNKILKKYPFTDEGFKKMIENRVTIPVEAIYAGTVYPDLKCFHDIYFTISEFNYDSPWVTLHLEPNLYPFETRIVRLKNRRINMKEGLKRLGLSLEDSRDDFLDKSREARSEGDLKEARVDLAMAMICQNLKNDVKRGLKDD